MAKQLTAEQKVARRRADARRYRRDRAKRIAAERAYEARHKNDPDFKAKDKARAKVNNAVRDGRLRKPAGADFHHTSISKGGKAKGRWMKKGTHRKLPNSKDAKVK
jgi:hypothetical protein